MSGLYSLGFPVASQSSNLFYAGVSMHAQAAGFDCIELHCGHGYLLSLWLCAVLAHVFGTSHPTL